MRILKFALLAVVASPAIAKDKGDSGFDLLKAALAHSNIRAEGSPSFHLGASFRLAADGASYQGTYSELWVSQRQWRRVVEIGGERRVEVGLGEKRWMQESQKIASLDPDRIVGILDRDMLNPELRARGASEKRINNLAARCVKLSAKYVGETYCIEPTDGILLSRAYASGAGHETYVYRNYEKFGDHIFPYRAEYTAPGEKLEITVSDLAVESAVDESLFAPLPNALELGNCAQNQMSPPKAKTTPDPGYPSGQSGSSTVTLSIVVDSDSKLHDIRIEKSGGTPFDIEAVRAVERWRMEPAKCNGNPIAAQVHIQVQFRRF